MRRFFLVLSIFLIFSAEILTAQTSIASVQPKDARTMGMGGSFKVFSEGYAALYGNPAGFAGQSSLTLGDMASWAYFKPTPLNIKQTMELANGQLDKTQTADFLESLLADNGFGGGVSFGLGWTGKGFGFGLTAISDSIAEGTTLDTAVFKTRNQANAIFGMAWPLEIGPIDFKFGASVRGFYLLETTANAWSFRPIANNLINGFPLLQDSGANVLRGGYGVAVDTGATIALGPLSLGVMVRDYGYKFSMQEATLDEITATYMVPMDGQEFFKLQPQYSAGLALQFNQQKSVATSFYFEADDPMSLIPLLSSDIQSIPSQIHIGAELDLLRFIFLRAGFNRGLLSLGAGIDFALIEVDAALFSEPLAASGQGRTGITLQGAIRF